MESLAAETIKAVSIWHFFGTVGVWLAFLTALFNAVVGVLGMNAVKPKVDKWPRWVWMSLGVGLLLALGAAWQTAWQLQQSDLDKRKADASEHAAEGRETNISGTLDQVKGSLGTISEHDAAMSDAIARIASAAHVSSDKPVEDIVREVVGKLPKPTVTTIKGDHNATAVGGGQAAQQQTVNAANGIGTIGGTLINPQVNNFGPPPAHFTFTENEVTPLKDHIKKMLEVHIRTDQAIPAATIGIVFSDPITFTKEFFEQHSPQLKPASIAQLDVIGPLARLGMPVPNSLGIIVNAPAAFSPGQDLIVTVESDKDVRTVEVMQFTRQ